MKDKAPKMRAQSLADTQTRREPTPAEMQAWIAEAAYYRAERRGFEPGHEADDWLAAESEIATRLRSARNVI